MSPGWPRQEARALAWVLRGSQASIAMVASGRAQATRPGLLAWLRGRLKVCGCVRLRKLSESAPLKGPGLQARCE